MGNKDIKKTLLILEKNKRLLKLLSNPVCKGPENTDGGCPLREHETCRKMYKLDYCVLNNLAQHLLNNGVIVPPVNIGDTVYVDYNTWGGWHLNTVFKNGKLYIVAEVVSIIKTKKQLLIKVGSESRYHSKSDYQRFPVSAIGITVFTTLDKQEQEE